MQTANEGQTIVCRQPFLDQGLPLVPKKGYPRAICYLEDDIIAELNPEQSEPGHWLASLTIPDLRITELTPLSIRWTLIDHLDRQFRVTSVVIVQPSQTPSLGDQVLMSDEVLELLLPVTNIESSIQLSFYQGNELVARLNSDGVSAGNYTQVSVSVPDQVSPKLAPYLTFADYMLNSKQRLMFNVWIVTPQILNCMNALESTLNKAKLDNIIPQLEYTQPDLLLYLQRGLNLFNSYSPNLTDFNGTNMQGALFDSLLLCASYYALGAQLLAEGMLAFNFSGQAVTLDVDRTPALESALGRVESQLTERIPKIKQMLLRHGVSGGSGADAVGSSRGFGHLVLSNAPTTNKAVFRPGFNRYFR